MMVFMEIFPFYPANPGPTLSLVLQGIQVVMITPLKAAQAHGDELKDSALRTSTDLRTVRLARWRVAKSGARREMKRRTHLQLLSAPSRLKSFTAPWCLPKSIGEMAPHCQVGGIPDAVESLL